MSIRPVHECTNTCRHQLEYAPKDYASDEYALPNISALRIDSPIGPKRARESPLRGFDPCGDPDDCLRRYSAVQLAVDALQDPAERTDTQARLDASDPLLFGFIADQAGRCTVYSDCETTDLIRKGTPVGNMTISVASALFVEPSGYAEPMLNFWGDPATGRGAPLRFFEHTLQHAKRIVFYNAAFDLSVAARGDQAKIREWQKATFDPYKLLRDAFDWGVELKLDTLLRDNGLATKTADGKEAVRMYAEGRYDELLAYNEADVRALRSLAELKSIKLSNGTTTTVGTLSGSSEVPSRYPEGDPRGLLQGSNEWKRAREKLLTASVAGAALGVAGAFRTRESVASALHEQLTGQGASSPGEEVDDQRRAAMQRGQRLEPAARSLYERLLQVRVEQSGLHLHPRYPTLLAASPDGILLKPTGELDDIMVEIKVPKAGSAGRGLSDAYLCQLQLTMACTGTKRADFVELLEPACGSRQLAVTRVELDRSLVSEIERQLLNFHSEAIEDSELYPINSVDATVLRSALRDARVESVGDTYVLEQKSALLPPSPTSNAKRGLPRIEAGALQFRRSCVGSSSCRSDPGIRWSGC